MASNDKDKSDMDVDEDATKKDKSDMDVDEDATKTEENDLCDSALAVRLSNLICSAVGTVKNVGMMTKCLVCNTFHFVAAIPSNIGNAFVNSGKAVGHGAKVMAEVAAETGEEIKDDANNIKDMAVFAGKKIVCESMKVVEASTKVVSNIPGAALDTAKEIGDDVKCMGKKTICGAANALASIPETKLLRSLCKDVDCFKSRISSSKQPGSNLKGITKSLKRRTRKKARGASKSKANFVSKITKVKDMIKEAVCDFSETGANKKSSKGKVTSIKKSSKDNKAKDEKVKPKSKKSAKDNNIKATNEKQKSKKSASAKDDNIRAKVEEKKQESKKEAKDTKNKTNKKAAKDTKNKKSKKGAKDNTKNLKEKQKTKSVKAKGKKPKRKVKRNKKPSP